MFTDGVVDAPGKSDRTIAADGITVSPQHLLLLFCIRAAHRNSRFRWSCLSHPFGPGRQIGRAASITTKWSTRSELQVLLWRRSLCPRDNPDYARGKVLREIRQACSFQHALPAM